MVEKAILILLIKFPFYANIIKNIRILNQEYVEKLTAGEMEKINNDDSTGYILLTDNTNIDDLVKQIEWSCHEWVNIHLVNNKLIMN